MQTCSHAIQDISISYPRQLAHECFAARWHLRGHGDGCWDCSGGGRGYAKGSARARGHSGPVQPGRLNLRGHDQHGGRSARPEAGPDGRGQLRLRCVCGVRGKGGQHSPALRAPTNNWMNKGKGLAKPSSTEAVLNNIVCTKISVDTMLKESQIPRYALNKLHPIRPRPRLSAVHVDCFNADLPRLKMGRLDAYGTPASTSNIVAQQHVTVASGRSTFFVDLPF